LSVAQVPKVGFSEYATTPPYVSFIAAGWVVGIDRRWLHKANHSDPHARNWTDRIEFKLQQSSDNRKGPGAVDQSREMSQPLTAVRDAAVSDHAICRAITSICWPRS